MVKRAIHSLSAAQLSEAEIRGIMALEERGALNTGISAVGHAAQTAHDWDASGSGPTRAVNVLKAQPAAVPTAREVAGTQQLEALRACTQKRPGIIGWLWTKGGGHFTVCVGPTADDTELKIVDPHQGIQYVDNTATGFSTYQVAGLTGHIGCVIVC